MTTIENLKKLLDEGSILYSKNGIIQSAKLPAFGDLIITTQNGVPVYKEIHTKEKL